MPATLPWPAQNLLAGLRCDLVEDEDICPDWLTTLADAPNPGPIRPEFRDLARGALT